MWACNQKIIISHSLQAANAKLRECLSEILSKFHMCALEQGTERETSSWEYSYRITLHLAIFNVFSYFVKQYFTFCSTNWLPGFLEKGHERDHVRKINSLKQLFLENRRRRVNACSLLKHNILFGCTALWTVEAAVRWWIPACTEHWLFLTNLRRNPKSVRKPFLYMRKPNLMFTVVL